MTSKPVRLDFMTYKRIGVFIFLVIIGNIVFAQKAEISINHIGFGKTAKEAYFTVHNLGEIILTNISFFVDEKEYRTTNIILSSKQGFQTILYLDSGEHLIEVKTPEGAYDSLNITILDVKEKTTIQPDEKLIFLKENKMWIGFMTLIVILVIGIWLLTKKSELKF